MRLAYDSFTNGANSCRIAELYPIRVLNFLQTESISLSRHRDLLYICVLLNQPKTIAKSCLYTEKKMKLIIGNKNYSSWSLRAWLFLKANDISFTETRLVLGTSSFGPEIRRYSGAAKVPVLIDQNTTIWDSIAICEYISEQYLDNRGWPDDPLERAIARASAAEMHSGFFELRDKMPMNCRATARSVVLTPELTKDIERIDSLWQQLRSGRTDGPWLFGRFTIADCMFAPVVFRFHTYGVTLSVESETYKAALLDHPQMQNWLTEATAETEEIEYAEVG